MGNLREARSERETGLLITTRIQQSEVKNTGKIRQFVRCFIHLVIPIAFKLSY